MRAKSLLAVVLLAQFLAIPCPAQVEASTVQRIEAPRLVGSMGREVQFFENRGQADPRARYVARAGAVHAFFTDSEVRLALLAGDRDTAGTKAAGLALSFELPGAATVTPGKQSTTHASWFRTEARGGSVCALPALTGISYRFEQAGASIDFRDSAGNIEYLVRVDAGASLESVRLRIEGARSLVLEPDGRLAAATLAGLLTQSAPRAWQLTADGTRNDVPCQFVLTNDETFGFEVAGRDPSRVLVIDPVLQFSSYLGGSARDEIHAMDVDAQGAIYVAGESRSLDFPTVGGALAVTSWAQVFAAKFSPSNNLVWSAIMGGTPSTSGSDPVAHAIRVDPTGNVFVAGRGSVPTTTSLAPSGQSDAWIMKLNPSASSMIYGARLPTGSVSGGVSGFDIDGAGAAYLVGTVVADVVPTTPGAFDTTFNGSRDAWVAKLNPSGTAYDWATYLGGSGFDSGWELELGPDGSVFVTGETQSADFPATPGALATNLSPSGRDGYVARLSPLGDQLSWATYIGGNGPSVTLSVHVDAQGIPIVAGWTAASNLPTGSGAALTSNAGGISDGYVARLASNGGRVLWGAYLGGAGMDVARDVAIDDIGNVAVVGRTLGLGFPTVPGTFDPSFNGGAIFGDAFCAVLDGAGQVLLDATYFGGSGDDDAVAVGFAPGERVVFAGQTRSTDLPTANPVYGSNPGGTSSGYVAVLSYPPSGASRLGSGSSSGFGTPAIGHLGPAQIGNSGFGLSCVQAPANGAGLLGIGPNSLATPLSIFGADIHVDPFVSEFVTLMTFADAHGTALVPLPVPSSPALVGLVRHAQFLWLDVTPGQLTASQGISLQIQP